MCAQVPEADTLSVYLAREMEQPFQWGRANGDCLLFLLGWAEGRGLHPSRNWRGAYHDEASAKAVLAELGGAVAAVIDVLGPPRMGSPAQRGDVGLLPVDDWHLGMIFTGAMWAFRNGGRGIRIVRRPAEIVWDGRLTRRQP